MRAMKWFGAASLQAWSAACLCGGVVVVGAAASQDAKQVTPRAADPSAQRGAAVGAENRPAEDEINPAQQKAIERGLAYLAEVQNEDGSFGRGRYGRHIAVAALGGLAFMADGNLPGRGRYGEQVAKALEFVLRNTAESGLLATDGTTGPMYGHGFATLFLGEIYGMNPSDGRVRDALVRAIDLIINSQNDEGGWRYNPVPYDADVSVTICEVMALRSARNAGIKVPRETIDRAVRYVRDCQNPDGGFRYMRQPGTSAWPRTAAGVASLFYAGIYEDDSIERGLDYLEGNAGVGAIGGPQSQAHYYYGQYYTTQAMYLAGGDRWQNWWRRARAELVEEQSGDGSWMDHQAGESYATSMALIVLQMPGRYLPIFQR
ncbi:MAG: terpene cyclase/mutase family protein [Phycisphaerae bacterium]|nr:terpene cyclase/mutase family protein [Phycisphaerae bacterium]